MATIKQILCPVSFTEQSEGLVKKAAFLAQLHQADLQLLHVINSLTSYLGDLYGFNPANNPEWFHPMTEQAKDKARDLLRDIKQRHIPLAVRCKSSVRYGGVVNEILAEAEELGADLIVLSNHTQDELNNLPIGTTAQDVISRAQCPVLTYRSLGTEQGFGKILVPVDLDFGAGELTDFLAEYFATRDPEVEFVSVIDPRNADAGYEERIKHFLQQFAEQLNKRDIERTKVNVLHGKQVGITLNDYAVAGDFQLIMMNTIGRSGLTGTILGSVTHQIVTRSRIPVLTYRAKNADEGLA